MWSCSATSILHISNRKGGGVKSVDEGRLVDKFEIPFSRSFWAAVHKSHESRTEGVAKRFLRSQSSTSIGSLVFIFSVNPT
jgi:hypothetical protein